MLFLILVLLFSKAFNIIEKRMYEGYMEYDLENDMRKIWKTELTFSEKQKYSGKLINKYFLTEKEYKKERKRKRRLDKKEVQKLVK
jgi:hypothetical protein